MLATSVITAILIHTAPLFAAPETFTVPDQPIAIEQSIPETTCTIPEIEELIEPSIDEYAYELERVGEEWRIVQAIPIDELEPPTLLYGNDWCDSCGEQYPTSDLAELDYGDEWHGPLCEDCRDYWDSQHISEPTE